MRCNTFFPHCTYTSLFLLNFNKTSNIALHKHTHTHTAFESHAMRSFYGVIIEQKLKPTHASNIPLTNSAHCYDFVQQQQRKQQQKNEETEKTTKI